MVSVYNKLHETKKVTKKIKVMDDRKRQWMKGGGVSEDLDPDNNSAGQYNTRILA